MDDIIRIGGVISMSRRTKNITCVGMFCAIAYVMLAFGRIPIVLFLSYDPKDIVIIIAGRLMGPLYSFMISAIVSFLEMFTVSDTGLIGCIMNIISSCSLACTAALIYKKIHGKINSNSGTPQRGQVDPV